MSWIATALEIAGALSAVLGGIALIQETYASLAWPKTTGRLVAWVPAMSADGQRVLGQKARLAFEVAGAAMEGECRHASDEKVVQALPVGSSAPLRYYPTNPGAPEIVGTLISRLTFPLSALTLAAVLFAISAVVH
jgi:hypothetical protein